MLITVVIPVYNQFHLTQCCLNSLLKNSSTTLEIYIIDNNSTDHTPEKLLAFKQIFEEKKHIFSIVTNKKNIGFGRAMNQGARLSTNKYLALLNNDTWLMPNWDGALIQTIEHEKVSMIGPYYYEKMIDSNIKNIAKIFINKNHGKTRKKWVSILMFFNRNDFIKIGMFDEQYFVTCEDTDLKIRMNKQNLSYLQTANCFIWHHSKGTRSNIDTQLNDYEREGLDIFIRKWGFDPRISENSYSNKLINKWRKIKDHFGFF